MKSGITKRSKRQEEEQDLSSLSPKSSSPSTPTGGRVHFPSSFTGTKEDPSKTIPSKPLLRKGARRPLPVHTQIISSSQILHLEKVPCSESLPPIVFKRREGRNQILKGARPPNSTHKKRRKIPHRKAPPPKSLRKAVDPTSSTPSPEMPFRICHSPHAEGLEEGEDSAEDDTPSVIRRLTQSKKGLKVVPAEIDDVRTPWDESKLLELQRQRLREAQLFHKRRRDKYTRALLASCAALRQEHCPSTPPVSEAIRRLLPKDLALKYARFVSELLQELQQRRVAPVILPPLGKDFRRPPQSVLRVPWIPKERDALSRAMASFPPTVRSVMAQVLRPLHTYTLVDILQGTRVGVGEGVELKVLVTGWKFMARKSRLYLREEWFPQAVDDIRRASVSCELSVSRSHAVIHAFNNLLASKLQQVLIRSVQGFLNWLGYEEEPWVGPRLKVDLALADGDITLYPGAVEVHQAFTQFFDELSDCVQLYRATWEEPEPPQVPKWRQRLAQEKPSDSDHEEGLEGGGSSSSYKPLRPLRPQRDTLVVTLSDAQWASLRDQANDSLTKAFEKAKLFSTQIDSEFRDVLSGAVKQQINAFMKSGATLADFADNVKHYHKYVGQASHIPNSAIVNVLRLEYYPLRQSLLAKCNNFVSVLRQKIISDHRDMIHQLQDQFLKMNAKMAEIPKTTSELFALMEVVEESKRITFRKLVDDVDDMTERLQIILDVVLLTEDDLVETAEVINWPAKIKPTIEKSVESLEDYKQTFEAALSGKTSEINANLTRIHELVGELQDLDDIDSVNKYTKEVKKIEFRLEKVVSLVTWVNQEETFFKFPLTSFADLDKLKGGLVPYGQLFQLVIRWRQDEKAWMDGDFTTLDPAFIDHETEDLSRGLLILQKTFKSKFKQEALEGDPKKARMNFDDPNPDNLLGPLRICAVALNQIKVFKEHLPLISVLCNTGLRPRHWVLLNKVAGFDITPNAGTSLRKVVKMNLDPLLKQFDVVSSGASREYNLERSLLSMREMWKSVKLKFVRHTTLDMEVLEGLEEMSSMVEDHLIKTHAVKNSPYVKPFVEEVTEWEQTLRVARRNVREWLRVQTLWVELSPLFSMADLPTQLPKENKMFREIDCGWRDAMRSLMESSNILDAVSDCSKLSQSLHFLKGLEMLQKSVYGYLHNKRCVFPRLFFLSNEELTSLVCEKDATLLGRHLRKCFEGVHGLRLDQELFVSHVLSAEGEELILQKKISTKHAQISIENWLLEFQLHLTQTMKQQVQVAAEWWGKYSAGKSLTIELFETMLKSFPLQVILTMRNVFFTADVLEAIRGGLDALSQCLKKCENEMQVLIRSVRRDKTYSDEASSPSSSRNSSLSLLREYKSSITTLILAGVHSRDFLRELVRQHVEDEGAFLWLSHLRLYLSNGPSIEARLLEVALPWGWEYVGSGGRLVYTPLTSRAHLALAVSFKSYLTAAHEGPAGTGKTETVKDLARVLAMHCVVFNCSESVDPKGVASLFTGLAAAGSWLCLDEFNKFQVGVLSVAAQQLLTVVTARRARESTFSISGMEPLALDPRGQMVVTLNPDYKGRVGIPDNLMLLLRPVAMLAADEESIVEVWLMATGFCEFRSLARRSIRVLVQCRTRLEPYSHYDFGLRTVRAVLAAAGRLREDLPEWNETEVMIRALREVNQPKLVSRDAQRFEQILNDFFPQRPPTPRPSEEEIMKSFVEECTERGMAITKEFEAKSFQLLSTLKERTGILFVGESCSSKSTIIKVLLSSLKRATGKEIFIEVLNPKTIPQTLLVGSLDPASRDWTDGRVASALRRAQKECVWIILDGPADASWVEQFNTALDDSKRLCLASGETLPIPPSLNIIFEVMDLSQASPAAVSRCGVVYVSESCISWRELFYAWKNGFQNDFLAFPWWENHVALLEELVYWIFPLAEKFIKIHCRHILAVKFVALVRPVFRLTASLVAETEEASKVSGKDRARASALWTIGAFLFAFAWSVGGALDTPSKQKFSTFYRRLAYGEDKGMPLPPLVEKFGCPFPSEGHIFEAKFDANQRSLWRPWTDVIKHMAIPENVPAGTIFVPTHETVSLLHVLKTFSAAEVPLLVVGQAGGGKTRTINFFLDQLPKDNFASLHLPITPAADVDELKSRVLRFLESRSFCGRISPKGQRKLLVCVDDLHLAPADSYEAKPIHEAIREAMQQMVWVNTANTSKINIGHVQWIARANINPSETLDRHEGAKFDPRCLSCFLPFYAESPSQASVEKIFATQIDSFLKRGGFVPDIFSVVGGVVSGLLEALRTAQKMFTTTLEQPHYNFSVTTALRVLTGMFLVQKEAVETKRHFIRLWVHEVFREFCDLLTRREEQETIYEIVVRTISSCCKDKLKTIFDRVCHADGTVDLDCLQNLRWGVLNRIVTSSSALKYEELPAEGKLQAAVVNFVKGRESLKDHVNVVVFKYVLEHVTRACRVLVRPRGNLLLVGDGGCGRKSLTKLAAKICDFRLETPQINAFDDYLAVRASLKTAMLAASLEEAQTVVIIGDDVIQHPKILHILHSILRTGYAPGILTLEDECNLIERLRLNSDTNAVLEDELWDLHILRVKEFLHLVITSPLTPTLSRVLAQYPALSTNTTTDFYQAWPEEAMRKVGEQSLEALKFRSTMRDAVVGAAIEIHDLARNVSQECSAKEGWCPKVTPASYLHLLQEFNVLYRQRQERVDSSRLKYKSGLEKLEFAGSQISVMKDMLDSLGPQIEVATTEVSSMMSQIEQESLEVENKTEIVAEEEEVAMVHAASAKILQEECQAELNQALPSLHAAADALDTLKPSDITLVKSMKNPPQVVKTVMSAVCVMMDIKPDKVKNAGKTVFDFWGASKRLLGDMTFLQQLKDYDKDNISEDLMDRINHEYLDLPEFVPAVVAKASSAAEGLCKWVRALAEYYEIAKIVAPKRERLQKAEAKVQELMTLLEEKRQQLRLLEEKLAHLHERFSVACAEKQRLEAEQLDCSMQLARAERLIRGLGGERDRWEKEKALTEEQLKRLPGDSLLAGASLAYLAPHPPNIREIQTKSWTRAIQDLGLEVSEPFSIIGVMATPLDLRAWNLQGLPSDNFSSENAIFIKNSVKWPMLVDPDDQGTRWLERHERSRGLVVVRAQDARTLIESNFAGGSRISVLEDALARTLPYGKPLLLRDLHGEPPPLLQPLLQKCIVKEAGIETIRMGKLKLKYRPEFRLYLATRQMKPNLPRESVNSINLINFTVTLHGLSDLLRQVLVQNEKPELEDERERLANSACDVQRRLQETEAKILRTLADAKGNILESEQAIQVLQEAKVMSDDLKQKEMEGRATEETILEYCRKYEKVSRPAARLYLLIASLPNLSNLYQFSLTWYLQLYVRVIRDSGKSAVLERRLKLLQEKLLSRVHLAVIKSLSIVDRLPFSVMLALHLLSSEEDLSEDENTWILQLSTKLGLEASPDNPPPSWLPSALANVWPLIISLKEMNFFADIEDSLQRHKPQWEKFLNEEEPSLDLLPAPWNKLQPIHALILVAVVSPSQILKTASQLVSKTLGPAFVNPPPFDVAPLLQPSSGGKGSNGSGTHQVPLLLITAPGVDPLEEIFKLAARRPELSVSVVSLGQGQEEAAESAINVALHSGGWVILQNVHHARKWLPELAENVNEICESYTTTKTSLGFEPHPEFRLILTTQPAQQFPVTLLRQLEKIAISPPVDAREGLLSAVETVVKECSTWGLDDLDMDAEQAALLLRLLYGLAVFHVLISERGRHGQRAWAAAPTFTQADLVLSLTCIRSMVEAGRELEKSAVEHLVGRIIYGGRIRRPQDEFVILSLLREVLKVALHELASNDDEEEQEEEGTSAEKSPEDGAEGEEETEEEKGSIASLFPDYIGELSDLLDFAKASLGLPFLLPYHYLAVFFSDSQTQKTIESLDHPELFGLPCSVKAVQAAKNGEDLLTSLTKLGGSVEEFRTEGDSITEHLLQIKDKLPKPILLEEKFFLMLPDKDMADVIQRESEGLNTTLRGVISTIDNAVLLLKTGNSEGKVEVAEEVVRSISIGRTPSVWETLDQLSTPQILQSFLNLLWMRNAFLVDWIESGCPSRFCLGSFQFLPALLSLVLRQAAFLKKVPLHYVEWKFDFTEEPSPDPTFLLMQMSRRGRPTKSEDAARDEDEENQNNESDSGLASESDVHKNGESCGTETDDAQQDILRSSSISVSDQCPPVVTEEHEAAFSDDFSNGRKKGEPGEETSEMPESNNASVEECLTKWKMLSINGILVYGLWLVGAAWDVNSKHLTDSPARQMIQLLPLVQMVPSESLRWKHLTQREDTQNDSPLQEVHDEQESSPRQSEGKAEIYDCPVYGGGPESSQSPVVFTIPLSSGPKGANHWIQRRVAVYTSKH